MCNARVPRWKTREAIKGQVVFMRRLIPSLLAGAVLGLLASCNTVSGVGKDLKKVTTPDSPSTSSAPTPASDPYDPYADQSGN